MRESTAVPMTSSPSAVPLALSIGAALVVSLALTRSAAAAGEARDAYDRDIACAALAADAASGPGRSAVDDPTRLQAYYLHRADASAAKAGIAADPVPLDVAAFRRSIDARLQSPDADFVRSERDANERVLKDCALLPAVELFERLHGKS